MRFVCSELGKGATSEAEKYLFRAARDHNQEQESAQNGSLWDTT